MLMEGKRKSNKNEASKEKKKLFVALMAWVASFLKGKQKNSLFRVLQHGCNFSYFSRSFYQQLCRYFFGSRRL
jgi:hypothetical protein